MFLFIYKSIACDGVIKRLEKGKRLASFCQETDFGVQAIDVKLENRGAKLHPLALISISSRPFSLSQTHLAFFDASFKQSLQGEMPTSLVVLNNG